MGTKQQLNDELYKALEERLKQVRLVKPVINTSDYEPSKKTASDYKASIENDALVQQIRHRDKLLNVVSFLACGSFILLVVVLLLQMIVKIFNPNYVGISDSAIQIISVSVFGQVLTVMCSLSYHLWKSHK